MTRNDSRRTRDRNCRFAVIASTALHLGALFMLSLVLLHHNADQAIELVVTLVESEAEVEVQVLPSLSGANQILKSSRKRVSQSPLAILAPQHADFTLNNIIQLSEDFGTGSGEQREPVNLFDGNYEGKSFAFVVDRSMSMLRDNRWTTLRQEVLRSLSRLTPQHQFCIVYGYDSRDNFGMDAAPMQPATQERKAAAVEYLANLSLDRGSNPDRAIRFAATLKPDVIFILGDGENYDDDVFQEINILDFESTTVVVVFLFMETHHRKDSLAWKPTTLANVVYVDQVPRIWGAGADTNDAVQQKLSGRLRLAESLMRGGHLKGARKFLFDILQKSPTSLEAVEACRLLAECEEFKFRSSSSE